MKASRSALALGLCALMFVVTACNGGGVTVGASVGTSYRSGWHGYYGTGPWRWGWPRREVIIVDGDDFDDGAVNLPLDPPDIGGDYDFGGGDFGGGNFDFGGGFDDFGW